MKYVMVVLLVLMFRCPLVSANDGVAARSAGGIIMGKTNVSAS